MVKKWSFDRFGYLAGVAFPLLAIGGIWLQSTRGEWPGDPRTEIVSTEAIADYYTGTVASRYGYLLMFAAVAALVWFVVSMRNRFLRTDPGSRAARVFAGLGFVMAGSLGIITALYAGLEQEDASGTAAEFLRGMFTVEMGFDGFWILAVLAIPFFLIAAAYAGFRGATPRWLAVLTALAAIPSLVGVFGFPVSEDLGNLLWVGNLILLGWALITGVTMAVLGDHVVDLTGSPEPVGVPGDARLISQ
ncbi:MAG: hypothetical protein HKO76_04090 [Acidimicrobiia bacterium]|nr:hypothetical protein [Acidimicrobiia bacterium]